MFCYHCFYLRRNADFMTNNFASSFQDVCVRVERQRLFLQYILPKTACYTVALKLSLWIYFRAATWCNVLPNAGVTKLRHWPYRKNMFWFIWYSLSPRVVSIFQQENWGLTSTDASFGIRLERLERREYLHGLVRNFNYLRHLFSLLS